MRVKCHKPTSLSHLTRSIILLGISLISLTGSLTAEPQAEDKAQVKAQPTEKINVLIVDGFSNHDWEFTTKHTRELLSASGLFKVDVSTAPSKKHPKGAQGPNPWDSWNPAFSQYDVVIQNSNSYGNRPTWPAAVQKNLEQYVKQGGGLLILHSANNAFPQWPEYNQMIGLGWRDKNFGPSITIGDDQQIIKVPTGEGGSTGHGVKLNTLLTRIGDHPIHRDQPRQWMAAELEIYFYPRGPAENITILSYAREPKTKLNFPTEWTVKYGQGRVYASTYGHSWHKNPLSDGMRCIAFHTSLIRASEWLATGDTTSPLPANFPDDQAIQLAPLAP